MVLINMIQRCANNWKFNIKRKKEEEEIGRVMEDNLAGNPDNKLENMMEQQYQIMEE